MRELEVLGYLISCARARILGCWIMSEVLGCWECTGVTKVGNESQQVWSILSVLVTSPAAPGQTVWPSSAGVRLFRPTVPMEGSSVGTDPRHPFSPPSGLHWRTESSPSKPGAEVNASVPGPFQSSQKPPVRPPQGWLARLSQLPERLPGQRGQLLSAGSGDFYSREGEAFSCRAVGEAHALPIPGLHTTQAVPPLYGERWKKEFFSHVSSHFNDCFSNYLKFWGGPPVFHSW